MEEIDQLLTIAEISVALAGFAGIIATFQLRNKDDVSRGRVVALTMIVNISLLGALFSMLPIGLFNFGMSPDRIWIVTSFLLGINQFAYLVVLLRRVPFRKVNTGLRFLFISLFTIGGLIGIANFLNSFQIIFDGGFGTMFTAFVFNLGLVCFMFSRLLLYPLWRSVVSKETSASE